MPYHIEYGCREKLIKRTIARLYLRSQVGRFLASPSELDRLFGRALLLQFRQISEDCYRKDLESFYRNSHCHSLMHEIEFPRKRLALQLPGGYKVRLTRLCRHNEALVRRPRRFDLWNRRIALCHHLSIRSDVLILRQGEHIPPHGHCRVVSGFYVLEGQVAVRQYDRIEHLGDRVLLRKSLDEVQFPGKYSTSSEFYQNVHWLCGIAPQSYLFRMAVTNTPTRTFRGRNDANERVYVDPTGPTDNEGLIASPYVAESVAKSLAF